MGQNGKFGIICVKNGKSSVAVVDRCGVSRWGLEPWPGPDKCAGAYEMRPSSVVVNGAEILGTRSQDRLQAPSLERGPPGDQSDGPERVGATTCRVVVAPIPSAAMLSATSPRNACTSAPDGA